MATAGQLVFILPKVMRPHPERPEGDQIREDRACPQSIVSRAGLRSSHELGSARPHRRRFFLWAGSIVMGVAAPGGVSPPSGPRSPPNRVANGMKPRPPATRNSCRNKLHQFCWLNSRFGPRSRIQPTPDLGLRSLDARGSLLLRLACNYCANAGWLER